MEVNDTNTETILRNMRSEGDSRAQYMSMMAAQLTAANERVRVLEGALKPFAVIPDSPFFCDGLHAEDMYAVVLAQYNTDFTGADLIRARAAVAGTEPAKG